VSDIPSRNKKPKNFQNRRTEFRTEVNLNKKECIEAMPPYMYSVQLYLSQSKRITIMDFRKETIKTEGRKPLLDAFQLVDIS
jgi:hypothetical protein